MLGGLQSAKIETACHIFHVPSTFKPVAHRGEGLVLKLLCMNWGLKFKN